MRKWVLGLGLLASLPLASAYGADATVGVAATPFTDPSTAVGMVAITLTFAHTPTVYLSFCNEAAAGGGYIAITDIGTAALNTQPSHTIWPGGCLIYENNLVPTGVIWSAIASASSTPLRVEYR